MIRAYPFVLNRSDRGMFSEPSHCACGNVVMYPTGRSAAEIVPDCLERIHNWEMYRQRYWVCDGCFANESQFERNIIAKTSEFAGYWLSPRSNSEDIDWQTFQNMRGMISRVDERMFRDFAQRLKYSAFLETRYWKSCAAFMRFKHDGCNRCPRDLGLQVHHKTYEFHGMEHKRFYKDLEVLCEPCHKEEHGIT